MSAALKKIAKGQRSIEVDLAAIRERISALKDEIDSVEGVSVTAEEALGNLEAMLGRVPSLKPNIGVFFGSDGAPSLSDIGIGTPAQDDMSRAASGTFVWLLADLLRDRLQPEIMAHAAEIGATMSRADRSAQLKKLKTDLLEAERNEEAMIEAAEEVGMAPLRRADADPRAVLGISG